jgi:hypothetical protein
MRVISAATWLNLDGWTMLGLPGQTILTTGGWLSGWTNSTVRVSAPLIGPWASVMDDEGKAGSVPVWAPGSATHANRGRPMWWAHKVLRSGVSPAESARSLHGVRTDSRNVPVARGDIGGRYWVRTSDLFGVKHVRWSWIARLGAPKLPGSSSGGCRSAPQ